MAAGTPVALGEVLKLALTPCVIEASRTYPNIGIYSFGRGVFGKPDINGATTSATTLYRIWAGQLIYSRLFAFEGAYALVPAAFDGHFVSNEFPTFDIDTDRASPAYIGWLFRRPQVWRALASSSTGMGDRRQRIHPERILEYRVQLPPLDKQQQIAARIGELTAQIEKTRAIRHETIQEVEALHLSTLHKHFGQTTPGWNEIPMAEAVEINDRQVDPTLPEYSQLPHISGANIEGKTCRLLPWRTAEADGIKSGNYLFSPGTVLYSKIRPYLRKAAYIDFRGLCSADIYPIQFKNSALDPHFLKWSLVAAPFTHYANRISGRTRIPKLNRKQFWLLSGSGVVRLGPVRALPL